MVVYLKRDGFAERAQSSSAHLLACSEESIKPGTVRVLNLAERVLSIREREREISEKEFIPSH